MRPACSRRSTLTQHTFENLRTTGDMRLIGSELVKEKLFEYYNYDEEQRQYRPLQFTTESRHFALAAGILDRQQVTFIQNEFLFFRPGEIEKAAANVDLGDYRVKEAAVRLSERAELIAWLPYVRSMQLEQIEVHKARLERAHEALQVLTDYAESTNPQVFP